MVGAVACEREIADDLGRGTRWIYMVQCYDYDMRIEWDIYIYIYKYYYYMYIYILLYIYMIIYVSLYIYNGIWYHWIILDITVFWDRMEHKTNQYQLPFNGATWDHLILKKWVQYHQEIHGSMASMGLSSRRIRRGKFPGSKDLQPSYDPA